MGGILLSQDILEQILQFVDGKTLLVCRDVSDEFEAAVKYLTETKNIWEQCYFKEKEIYPYAVISKFYPHNEGLNHPINWGLIYETCFQSYIKCFKNTLYIKELNIGKHYSDIQDIEVHEDLLFILVKYNKNFSIFYRILTVNLDNIIVDKSCQFFTNLLYVTPIEDSSNVKADAIKLSCDLCQVVAVPVSADETIKGFPKFARNKEYLTVEHSNGEYYWINYFGKFINKGKCFHMGKNANYEEIKSKDLNTLKIYQGFTSLYIKWGDTQREFNTFKDLRTTVTTSMYYSNIMILGTQTGMIYAYYLNSESDLKVLNLGSYIWHYNVCCNSIIAINVMELKNEFVIVCCTAKNLYSIHMQRELKNFIY